MGVLMSSVLTVLLVLIAAFAARLKVRELDDRFGDRWTDDDRAPEREALEAGPFRSTSIPRFRQGIPRRQRFLFGLALTAAAVVGGTSLWSAIAHYHALGPEPDLRGVVHARAHRIAAERDATRLAMIAEGALVLVSLSIPTIVTRLAARAPRLGARR
jgi:hypothetical protein